MTEKEWFRQFKRELSALLSSLMVPVLFFPGPQAERARTIPATAKNRICFLIFCFSFRQNS